MGKRLLPTLPQVTAETISILIATLVAAFVISKVPAVQAFVKRNSLTLSL